MPGARQAQRLGAAPHTDVEHPQPTADREPPGQLLVQLPGDQLLPYELRQPTGAGRPGLRRTPGRTP
ncbi:hypothetical protein [Streptomyces poriticola]|uniref:hypothetical protein n=1 Tax=Streptomyces poriticola TaxID=3120506 RepID=UPI002FCDFB45